MEQQTQRVVSLHKFGHFMASYVVSKNKDNGKLYEMFFCNKPKSVSKQVFVLCDGSHQFRASVLSLIMAESQSEMRTGFLLYKKNTKTSIFQGMKKNLTFCRLS